MQETQTSSEVSGGILGPEDSERVLEVPALVELERNGKTALTIVRPKATRIQKQYEVNGVKFTMAWTKVEAEVVEFSHLMGLAKLQGASLKDLFSPMLLLRWTQGPLLQPPSFRDVLLADEVTSDPVQPMHVCYLALLNELI
jgi:hypothetical protein